MGKRKLNLPNWSLVLGILVVVSIITGLVFVKTGLAAYNHNGDTDSAKFRAVYPAAVGTKIDSCTTCHSGGSYTSGGKTTTLGSCQWCHYVTNYGADESEATLDQTLNAYGKAYKIAGRSEAALLAIQNADSDLDNYSNLAEIQALTYPGDAKDNPSQTAAPSRIFTLQELEGLPQYSQFMVMNASKSDDTYVTYTGVILEDLIKALKLDSATGITVYSPDGFATYHPFNAVSNPNSYHVFGTYPQASFYYDAQADMVANQSTGWVDYRAPSVGVRNNGDLIYNPLGLKMLLAYQRDGKLLQTGQLNVQNKLDGEGPYRIVPPQKNPGPPDQRSTATQATDPGVWVWPYKSNADHNAGFASRTVTMIRVEPLPTGTTDINTLEAGWPYVDSGKIIIYGAIDPNPANKINLRLDDLASQINNASDDAFTNKSAQKTLINKIDAIKNQVQAHAYNGALNNLQEDVLKKMDGVVISGKPDNNDWVTDSDIQRQLYSTIDQIWILLKLVK